MKKYGYMNFGKKNLGLSNLALSLAVSLVAAGCGGSGTPKPKTAADEEAGLLGGADDGGKLGGAANADQLIPKDKKEKKRAISDDQRADFQKAAKRYADAKKNGGPSGGECTSIANAFKSIADDAPILVEARFNQGAVLASCGREDEAIRIWESQPKYGPAITNIAFQAWKNNDIARAESLFNRAITEDPLHTVEARNNLAQILRDKARRASGDEKKQYVGQAVSNLRTVLALDSNNLQAFSTLAFIYYDMNMLEMAKLVGNQAIKKADEIATGEFEEEKVEEAADAKAGKGGKKGKKEKKEGAEDEGGVKSVNVREAGTGVTADMKKDLAVVYNTLGLVELKKKNISPAIQNFKKAVGLNPNLAEARLNLAALSLNNRDYNTAEENFKAVIQLQPKNYEASIGLGVALRGNKKIDEAEAQYNAAQKLDPSAASSYFNLGLLYQDYKDGQKPALHKAQDYYRQFLGHATGSTPQSLKSEAEKRIKDIDEIYVALDEAAKMQAEAEEMQRKAEEQQKKMEEEMKKQEAAEKAAADKAVADKAAADKAAADKAAAGAGDKADKAATDKGAEGAAPAGDAAAAPPADKPAGKKKGKKK
jgi:tetratricopeptide (TPR) repeat protein